MNIIAAVDKNWAIGKNNELLVRIPMDQKFFRETTTGKVVVMGRKTLESFPNGLPLKNRTNIVLTHNPAYQVKDAIVVHSMEERCTRNWKSMIPMTSMSLADRKYMSSFWMSAMSLISQRSIMHMMRMRISRIWMKKPEWKVTADSEEQTYFDLEFISINMRECRSSNE